MSHDELNNAAKRLLVSAKAAQSRSREKRVVAWKIAISLAFASVTLMWSKLALGMQAKLAGGSMLVKGFIVGTSIASAVGVTTYLRSNEAASKTGTSEISSDRSPAVENDENVDMVFDENDVAVFDEVIVRDAKATKMSGNAGVRVLATAWNKFEAGNYRQAYVLLRANRKLLNGRGMREEMLALRAMIQCKRGVHKLQRRFERGYPDSSLRARVKKECR